MNSSLLNFYSVFKPFLIKDPCKSGSYGEPSGLCSIDAAAAFTTGRWLMQKDVLTLSSAGGDHTGPLDCNPRA